MKAIATDMASWLLPLSCSGLHGGWVLFETPLTNASTSLSQRTDKPNAVENKASATEAWGIPKKLLNC